MYKSQVGISAQALVITPTGEIILEDNKKIGRLSFIGGKLEEQDRESDIKNQALNIVVREVGEEFDIRFQRERFQSPQIQPITRFGTGLWKSTYFILGVTQQEVEQIMKNHTEMRMYSEQVLRENFLERLPINPKRFFKQFQRAKAIANQI